MVSSKIKAHERDAVIKSLAAGVVPTIGLQHIQVDRKDEILAIIGDMERVGEGGAAARFVIGKFGAGKSFFLNLTKSVAIAKKFVVMQADITMKKRLVSTTGYARALYTELVCRMSAETRTDGGAFDVIMGKWARDIASRYPAGFDVDAAVREELKPLQDMAGGFNFISVAAKYCKSVPAGEEKTSRAAKKWLSGGFGKLTEAKAELGTESFINDKDIYDYLKIWAAFVRLAGFSGLLVMIDEMGLLAQGVSNHAARDGNYEVILHILNDCLQGRASGIGFIFAGADFFLDDPKNGLMGHGALASRLAPNPFARGGLKDLSGPVIRLGEFTPEDLYLLFENIREIFAMGDRSKYLIPDEAIQSFMNLCAWSLGEEFYKTPRDAVKLFTGFLSVLQQNAGVGWRNVLDSAEIETGEREIPPAPAVVKDVTPAQGKTAAAAQREIEFETEETPAPLENGGETRESEDAEKPAPEKTAESVSGGHAETAPVPVFPELKREFAWIFEPVLSPAREPDASPEPEIPPELEPESEVALGTVEITDEGKQDAYRGFEFDFGPDIGGAPDYATETGFELGPGPELYVAKPSPETYDPNILYILPDAGSSRDMPLRLVKPERRNTGAAAEPTAEIGAAARNEEDMRVGHVLYGNGNDLKVFLPNMISRNPLIGMERILPGVHNNLVRMSGKILINAYNDYPPNSYEKMLLSVTIINIAKRWTSDDGELFWNFIGRQLGFDKDAREALYGTMRSAVFETMKSHHRFFSQNRKTNKRDFYATIMAHALATRGSMYSLFDFLSDFYRENLRCRVIKGDPAVGVMASELRKRFDENDEPWNVRLKGKYSGICVGLAAIIVKRPNFFRKFAEEILMKIDGLTAGLRLENTTYLDELLNSWSGQRAPLDTAREVSRHALKLPPAVAYDEIRPCYEVTGSSSVNLVIPSVRLDAEPPGMDAAAEITCGESRCFENLRVYGDEFARTIEEKRIAVSGLSRFASSGDLMIKVMISAGGKSIYDSGTSLYRDIIVFSGEDEIPLQSVGKGLYSVFSSIDRYLSFDESADDRGVPASSGQMRAVKFEDKCGISVDGRVVHTGSENDSFEVVISAEPCREATFLRRGNEYGIYTERFSVTIRVPERHSLDRYAFRLCGSKIPFRKCVVRNSDGVTECAVEATPGVLKGGIFDAAVTDGDRGGKEVFRICCRLIEGLSISYDRPYYFEDAHGGTVWIDTDARRIEWPLGGGESVMVPFEDGDLKIKVPLVFWRAVPSLWSAGKENRAMRWHASIPPDTKLEIMCPDEVACKLKMGDNTIEHSKRENGLVVFNLGDSLRAAEFGRDEEIVQAELLLESADDNSSRELFPICLQETFEESPKFEVRDGALSLKNHWAFVGPSDGRLEYSFKGRVCESYVVRAGDSVISPKCGLPHGNYQYRVLTLSGDEAAPKKKVIMSGSCILGDVDIFHFDNKLLEIRRVRSGFKEFFIQPVYVENLEFAETRAQYDDGVCYPVYGGVCYSINRDDQKVYFGDNFNPVQIVIINERDICLYGRDGRKPCLIYDSRHKIVAEPPDSKSGIVYYIPDFYEYEALDGN